MRARYYAPEYGRFTTRDTYTGEQNDPLSLNLYTYCHGDPVNYFDPTGHWNFITHRTITKMAIDKLSNKNKKVLEQVFDGKDATLGDQIIKN